MIAGVLHDVIEKAGVSEARLRRAFGSRVTRLVLAVTDDQSISAYAKRKAALRQQVATAGDEALTLFAADKLSMSRELRREIKQDPGGRKALREHRLKHYQRSLAMLQERIPDSPLLGELGRELCALERQHTAARA